MSEKLNCILKDAEVALQLRIFLNIPKTSAYHKPHLLQVRWRIVFLILQFSICLTALNRHLTHAVIHNKIYINKNYFKSMKIKSLPLDDRPREKLIKHGAENLTNSELLAIILRVGNKKENVLDLSNKLFNKYNIRSLSRVEISKLKKEMGIGNVKACQIIACFELGRRLAAFKKEIPMINEAKDIARIFMPEMSALKQEHFKGIYLNSRKRIIKEETIFVGSLNESVIHPREIFKIALDENAAALILLHNHPSGDPTPSEFDIEVTKELVKAGDILGIKVLDHVILGENKYLSFKEEGLIF